MNAAPVVMVVDDDSAIRHSLSELLRDEGYAVTAFENGQRALDWLRSSAVRPRVVLLDLMMPVMDGFAFLEEKEKDPAIEDLPVVVITAGNGCGEVTRRHRIADCFPKPFSVTALLAAVGRA